MDTEKKLVCLSHDIFLVPVPFWWDGKENSLVKIIKQAFKEWTEAKGSEVKLKDEIVRVLSE